MNKCYIIAEAGLNHNGDLEIAKKLIDLASSAGADAVKFQKRTVSKLATNELLDQKDDRFPEFGSTYRRIREHLEFGEDEYRILKEYASTKTIDFLITAFDEEAVDFLERLDVEAYKIASHGATNLGLLQHVAKTRKHTFLSTGMTDLDEVDRAVDIFKANDTQLTLLHCVSSYPTPLDECNLKMIYVLRDRYKLPVGYSGHELGYLPSLAAVAMGSVAIERHYTLDKNMVGFDHKISLEPQQLIEMVRNIRDIEKMLGDGEKYVSETEMITRKKYHVSMVASQDIAEGEVLAKDMIAYRNPGTGLPPKDEEIYVGKKVSTNIPRDTLISGEMFV